MATCQSCYKRVPEGAPHCPHCGTAQPQPEGKKTVFGYAATDQLPQLAETQQAAPAPDAPEAMAKTMFAGSGSGSSTAEARANPLGNGFRAYPGGLSLSYTHQQGGGALNDMLFDRFGFFFFEFAFHESAERFVRWTCGFILIRKRLSCELEGFEFLFYGVDFSVHDSLIQYQPLLFGSHR